MPLDIASITDFTLILGVMGLIWLPIWWVLDILTPKIILEHYFKEPHFNRGELIAFNLFPASLMRTVIFGWLLWFPSLGKKRQLTDLIKYTPKWYCITLKSFIFGSMSHGIIFIGLLICVIIYLYFFQ